MPFALPFIHCTLLLCHSSKFYLWFGNVFFILGSHGISVVINFSDCIFRDHFVKLQHVDFSGACVDFACQLLEDFFSAG